VGAQSLADFGDEWQTVPTTGLCLSPRSPPPASRCRRARASPPPPSADRDERRAPTWRNRGHRRSSCGHSNRAAVAPVARPTRPGHPCRAIRRPEGPSRPKQAAPGRPSTRTAAATGAPQHTPSPHRQKASPSPLGGRRPRPLR
jgi:hypothetical protein